MLELGTLSHRLFRCLFCYLQVPGVRLVIFQRRQLMRRTPQKNGASLWISVTELGIPQFMQKTVWDQL